MLLEDSKMILIDTNKYLAFYQSERISTLIPILRNLRDHVFVSHLIVDEVERNKFNCFKQTVSDQLKTPKWSFPDHILPQNTQSDQLRDDVKLFMDSAEALRRRLADHLNQLEEAVAQSSDHISLELKQFFGTPSTPNDDQLRRARFRKEVNNPPGKRSDPLGDELTWEQFLDASAHAADVWVLSGDHDYFVKVGKSLHLNPVLHRDLCERAPRTSINCFETWAEAIPHFLNKMGLSKEGLPSEQCLDDFKAEERALPTVTTTTTTTTTSTTTTPPPWHTSRMPGKPDRCPSCYSEDTFNDGGYLRSQYGGLTLQYVCKCCGYHLDTGDSWD